MRIVRTICDGSSVMQIICGLLHNSVKHVEDEAVKKAVQRCSSEV